MSQYPLPSIPGPAMERAPMPLERQSLFGFLGCSVLMHGSAVLSAVAMTGVYAMMATLVPMCRPPEKLEMIEVSMVALPKSERNVPDRAARVKATTGEAPPTPEPPPVKESDLVIEVPKPPPDPGNAEELRRQQIIEDARKRMLEENLLAAEGTVDRNATDVNGQEDLDMAVLGVAAAGDPEVARWKAKVQALMMQNFHPLAAPAGTDCVVNIWVEPDSGRILKSKVTDPSGVLPFDSAAERAVGDVDALPLAPEKYRQLFAKAGVGIRFSPP